MSGSGTSIGKGRALRSTPKALLVELFDVNEERWIPISVIHDDSEVYEEGPEVGDVVVATWWAEKEGLS